MALLPWFALNLGSANGSRCKRVLTETRTGIMGARRGRILARVRVLRLLEHPRMCKTTCTLPVISFGVPVISATSYLTPVKGVAVRERRYAKFENCLWVTGRITGKEGYRPRGSLKASRYQGNRCPNRKRHWGQDGRKSLIDWCSVYHTLSKQTKHGRDNIT